MNTNRKQEEDKMGQNDARGDRRLSRRQMLGFTAAAAAATLAGCAPGRPGNVSAAQAGTTALGETTAAAAATPSCILTPEVTEGPYYLDLTKIRKNVTEGSAGIPVRLRTTVVDTSDGCRPLENAAVDIWHCDAGGVYSGFTQQSLGGGAPPPPPPGGSQYGGAQYGPPPGGPPPQAGGPEAGNAGAQPTDDTTFLRGVQLTNADGVAEFETIYPGWYAGRALHIHLKVHVGGRASGGTYEGGHVSHTGQLFFPEDVTDEVATLDPYVNHGDVERVRQQDDGIFLQAGEGSIVTLKPLVEGGSVKDGFVAEISLGVDPNATPDPADMGPAGGPPAGALPSTGGPAMEG